MDTFEFITDKVPQTELLAQLAEEAVELAHAALKLRRTYDDTNPTPVTSREAFEKLKEELADVQLLVNVLGFHQHGLEICRTMQTKLERWAQRLKEVQYGTK